MPRRRGGTGGGSAGGGGAAAALGESGTLRALAGVAVAVALTWWGTTLWDKLVDNVVPLAFVVFCLAAALSALSPDETAAATGQLAPSGRHSLLAAHDDLPGPPTPGSESDGYPASSRGGRGGRSRSQPYLALVAGGNGSSGSGPATRRRVLSAIGFETDSSDSSSGALVVAADRSGALARSERGRQRCACCRAGGSSALLLAAHMLDRRAQSVFDSTCRLLRAFPSPPAAAVCTLNCSVCNSRHFAPDISRRMRCDVHGSHPAQPGSVWREEVAAPGGRVQLRTLLAWDGGVLDVTDSLGVCHGWTAELTRLVGLLGWALA